jgi:hypothetical protein
MIQNLCCLDLGQVSGEIYCYLCAHFRVQFVEQLTVDFATGRQHAPFDFLRPGEAVEAFGQFTHQPLSLFQLDIVPLAVTHAPGAVGFDAASTKAAGGIRDLFDQVFVRAGVGKMFQQFEARSAVQFAVCKFVSFVASQIRYDNQCVFHFI